MSEENVMEEITPPYKYCPMCAAPLVERFVHDANRLACPECSYILFLAPKLVAVVTVIHHGKVLLGRRNINPALGEWSFVSGYIDRGEKVEEAAIREVKEETNLDVQLERLIGIFSSRGNPYVILAFQANIVNGDLSALAAQPDEVSELAFFALDEMPALAFPTDSTILQALRQPLLTALHGDSGRTAAALHGDSGRTAAALHGDSGRTAACPTR